MREKIQLGVLTAVIALLAIGLTAWAAPPPSGEAEPADFDIYRTGTPDYDLVLRSYGEVVPRVLEHLRWPGGPRADGYYWLPIEEDERDVVHDVIEQLQQMMGEDFPIAVSVVKVEPAPIDEAAQAALEADVAEFFDEHLVYQTGTPNLDLVREFHDESREFRTNLKYWSEFAMTGYTVDGYYLLMIKEENWDVIHHTVYELQQMMGDDFPVTVMISDFTFPERFTTAANTETGDGTIATTSASNDVFGGHRTTIQTAPFVYDRQTLAFAAIYGGEVGMVLSGHYLYEIMPVGARVYSPTSYYPFRTNQIGVIHHVACDCSETSYMSPGWSGPDRIKAGVQHYGSHLPVWSWEEPELGTYVYKTGRTTGTTLGQVVALVNVESLCGGWLYDQFLAVLDSDDGDSGAPVYWVQVVHYPIPNGWWPPDPEFAFLRGVLFAGGSDVSIFSPMDLVLDDLDVIPLPGPFG